MLTVKHITIADQEHLYEALSVSYEPGGACSTLTGPAPARLIAYLKDGETHIQGGTVFVMNENGKTVSRYDLGASSVPIVGDGLSDPRSRGLVTTKAA
jgi:hypothetical protein